MFPLIPNIDEKDKASETSISPWKLGKAYTITDEIGSGSYATVYKGFDGLLKKNIAIKKFNKALDHPKLAQHCLREVEILNYSKHPNIIKLHKTIRVDKAIYIIMDYMPLDLRKLIHSPIFLGHDQVRKIMYDILTAINYLHSAKIVHRDIKPGNILFNSEGNIRLCDFGMARSISGLKMTKYDLDELYRKEFASSSDSKDNKEDEKEKEKDEEKEKEDEEEEEKEDEDIDEHAAITTKCYLQGHFLGISLKPSVSENEGGGSPLANKGKLMPFSNIAKGHSFGVSTEKKMLNEETKSKTAYKNAVSLRADFLKKMKSQPYIERELSNHIASRWYRSPEVILLEKVYYGAVDMWAAGCVFAELLQMIKENKIICKKRRPIFPGTSCFPLSPQLKPGSEGEIEHFQQGDQLITICKILGTPSENESGFITDPGAKKYIGMLPQFKKEPFGNIFPGSTKEEIDLLEKLVSFNPYLRITAKEALRHSYFKLIRNKALELERDAMELTNELTGPGFISKLAEISEEQKNP